MGSGRKFKCREEDGKKVQSKSGSVSYQGADLENWYLQHPKDGEGVGGRIGSCIGGSKKRVAERISKIHVKKNWGEKMETFIWGR